MIQRYHKLIFFNGDFYTLIIGLASQERDEKVTKKIKNTDKVIDVLKKYKMPLSINNLLEEKGGGKINEKYSAFKLLKRPKVEIEDLIKADDTLNEQLMVFKKNELEQASISIKYESYIKKEQEQVMKVIQLEDFKIRRDIDYDKIIGLSNEGREKLNNIRPETIGCASRISGVSAADVSILMVYLSRQ